jgi:tetratricopeptide (TPR) repeat protein
MKDRISQLQSFLEQSPADCFLHHALALEYMKLGRFADAEKHFEINLKNDPSYVATYYHLGKLLSDLGNTQKAISVLEAGMQYAKLAQDDHAFRELRSAWEELADI